MHSRGRGGQEVGVYVPARALLGASAGGPAPEGRDWGRGGEFEDSPVSGLSTGAWIRDWHRGRVSAENREASWRWEAGYRRRVSDGASEGKWEESPSAGTGMGGAAARRAWPRRAEGGKVTAEAPATL